MRILYLLIRKLRGNKYGDKPTDVIFSVVFNENIGDLLISNIFMLPGAYLRNMEMTRGLFYALISAALLENVY